MPDVTPEHPGHPESPLRQERAGAVLTLTLDRPAVLNSFTTDLLRALFLALDAAAEDASVRCVVLTGAGRAFCAGQDLADPAVAPQSDIGHLLAHFYRPMLLRLRSMPVPVIAAVNGVAAGAGANLALACDLVVAARSASFIQAFSKIGLVPDCGGTWLLPRAVGRARALGLAMLGDRLPAQEAERIGLIWRCVDDAELAGEVGALAARLAAMPTRALVETRRALDAAQQTDLAGALDHEQALQRELGFAHDYQEGVAAFMARRAPSFSDR
jgi:2-(1,2-epoxy-1,2-dihydrophenyl)acetyl-CoA isomerase